MFWKLLVAVAVVAGLAYWRARRKLYRLLSDIPFLPNSYPIIGHASMFIGTDEDRMNALQKIGCISNEQGGLLGGWLGNKLFICMTDPPAIEVVCKTCLAKDEFTIKYFRTAIGNGSLVAPVNIWHPRRKRNALFFSSKNLNRLVRVFDEKSAIMCKLMRVEAGRGDFPIWNYLTTFTFDSICETTAGIEINSQKNPNNEILYSLNELLHMIAKRILQPWLHPNYVYEKLPIYKELLHHKQVTTAFIDEIVQRTRKKIAATPNDSIFSPSPEIDDSKNWMNFLEMIMRSPEGEEGRTDEELREELMIMITAGNDTSAVSTSFTAVMLSRHPDVQDKVYQELEEVFGESDRPVAAEDLPRLKYLEAVIKEVLRLYPPVPVIVREVYKNVKLPSGATLVDGTSVLVNIWATHRNPAYWGPDADEFRPDRFLEGLRHPVQYLPFSYSVRGCLGSTYAMLNVKTALANLVRRFRLLPPTGARAADLTAPIPVKYDIMMRAVDNFTVRIEERNNSIRI